MLNAVSEYCCLRGDPFFKGFGGVLSLGLLINVKNNAEQDNEKMITASVMSPTNPETNPAIKRIRTSGFLK